MGALLVALAPLISNLVAGEAVHAALAGITTSQWVSIGADALNLVDPFVAAKIKAIHPQLDAFIADVQSGKDIAAAAVAISTFFRRPWQPPTIPEYDARGGVIEGPNPDFKPGD